MPPLNSADAARQAALAERQTIAGARSAAAGTPKARSTEKVTVACKVELPWLDLEVSEMVSKKESGKYGERTVDEAVRTGMFIRIRGTSYPRGTPPAGMPPPPMMVAGFALNFGIDKEIWEKWLDQHKHDDMVKNGLIFAYPEADRRIMGACKEKEALLSGVEALDTRNDANGRIIDPRSPRPIQRDVGQLTTEEERAKRMALHMSAMGADE